MAYKVFTNGSTLQASEINDNLMKQAVATFSNAAARTAAIPSPVEGQLTYLEDVDRYDHWNGSAWVSPFGSTLISSITFTSQTSVNIDNVFSSQYDNYKVFLTVFGTTAAEILMQLRAGGSNISLANYCAQQLTLRGATFANARLVNQTASVITVQRAGGAQHFCELTFSNPFNTENTIFQSYTFDSIDDAGIEMDFGMYKAATSATGFRIFSSTFSGRLSVYGMRK